MVTGWLGRVVHRGSRPWFAAWDGLAGVFVACEEDQVRRWPLWRTSLKNTRYSECSILTFDGGVGEIGGNKILFETELGKTLLDFGRRMGINGSYYLSAEFQRVSCKHVLYFRLLFYLQFGRN